MSQPHQSPPTGHAPHAHAHPKLGQLYATAICGNDILSSCLYVSGIAAIFAGVYAPIVLLIVGIVLWFFRHVYTEVVEALPVNGGAYNCLLNGSSKPVAAIAGVMTILSYIATACISAKVGVEYFIKGLEGLHEFPGMESLAHIDHLVMPGTILLLGLFAALVIGGLKDSAKVALFIFIFHIITLTLIIVAGVEHVLGHGLDQFWANAEATKSIVMSRGSLVMVLYLAFSASLLGVSGFESSANFVEEQEKGVFRKTLRNMWLGVTIFNPLMALVALTSLPISVIEGAKDFMLADVAFELGKDLPIAIGPILLKELVAIDAILVLAGAVLTSYVGVGGLIQRMALDGCLPSVLTKKNSKGSYPITVITFFVLCTSILMVTGGELLSLAGVYTIAFLGVMTLFAAGNLILKREREELKRTYWSPVKYVVIALLATALGMLGNMIIDAKNVQYFLTYFIPAFLLVMVMIFQDYLIEGMYKISAQTGIMKHTFKRWYDSIVRLKIVVFVHDLGHLHGILKYIARNEVGRNVVLISCAHNAKEKQIATEITESLPVLKAAGVYDHLTIVHETMDTEFGADAINAASKRYHVPVNRILIGSIRDEHEFTYDELGGVRIIH